MHLCVVIMVTIYCEDVCDLIKSYKITNTRNYREKIVSKEINPGGYYEEQMSKLTDNQS